MRKHVMVRIGGGWDTFEHYITKHDPCRTTIGGMYFFFPYIFYSFSWMKKHIPDSMERLYIRNISMYRMLKKFRYMQSFLNLFLLIMMLAFFIIEM